MEIFFCDQCGKRIRTEELPSSPGTGETLFCSACQAAQAERERAATTATAISQKTPPLSDTTARLSRGKPKSGKSALPATPSTPHKAAVAPPAPSPRPRTKMFLVGGAVLVGLLVGGVMIALLGGGSGKGDDLSRAGSAGDKTAAPIVLPPRQVSGQARAVLPTTAARTAAETTSTPAATTRRREWENLKRQVSATIAGQDWLAADAGVGTLVAGAPDPAARKEAAELQAEYERKFGQALEMFKSDFHALLNANRFDQAEARLKEAARRFPPAPASKDLEAGRILLAESRRRHWDKLRDEAAGFIGRSEWKEGERKLAALAAAAPDEEARRESEKLKTEYTGTLTKAIADFSASFKKLLAEGQLSQAATALEGAEKEFPTAEFAPGLTALKALLEERRVKLRIEADRKLLAAAWEGEWEKAAAVLQEALGAPANAPIADSLKQDLEVVELLRKLRELALEALGQARGKTVSYLRGDGMREEGTILNREGAVILIRLVEGTRTFWRRIRLTELPLEEQVAWAMKAGEFQWPAGEKLARANFLAGELEAAAALVKEPQVAPAAAAELSERLEAARPTWREHEAEHLIETLKSARSEGRAAACLAIAEALAENFADTAAVKKHAEPITQTHRWAGKSDIVGLAKLDLLPGKVKEHPGQRLEVLQDLQSPDERRSWSGVNVDRSRAGKVSIRQKARGAGCPVLLPVGRLYEMDFTAELAPDSIYFVLHWQLGGGANPCLKGVIAQKQIELGVPGRPPVMQKVELGYPIESRLRFTAGGVWWELRGKKTAQLTLPLGGWLAKIDQRPHFNRAEGRYRITNFRALFGPTEEFLKVARLRATRYPPPQYATGLLCTYTRRTPERGEIQETGMVRCFTLDASLDQAEPRTGCLYQGFLILPEGQRRVEFTADVEDSAFELKLDNRQVLSINAHQSRKQKTGTYRGGALVAAFWARYWDNRDQGKVSLSWRSGGGEAEPIPPWRFFCEPKR